MNWQNYQLGEEVSKVTEDVALWRTEKGMLEINKNALALPIKLDDKLRGYVFHGHGKLLLDTIVETEEGAIGKPVEREVNEPFLMLGKAEEIQQHLNTASEEDLTKMDYESQQELMARAEELCTRFFRKGNIHSHECCSEVKGFIFAFANKTDKLDILVARNSKIVYKAKDMIFVSNKDKVVLKSLGEVVCANNGKSIIVKRKIHNN